MAQLTPEQCLSVLHRGANALRRGNLDIAGQHFAAVLEAAKTMPKEQSYALLPIATANLSLLATKKGNADHAAGRHPGEDPLVLDQLARAAQCVVGRHREPRRQHRVVVQLGH